MFPKLSAGGDAGGLVIAAGLWSAERSVAGRSISSAAKAALMVMSLRRG
jgi:hypothetical protein